MSDLRSFRSKWYAHVHIDDKYMLIIFKLTLKVDIVACGVSSDKTRSSTHQVLVLPGQLNPLLKTTSFVDAGVEAKLFNNCINKPFYKTFPLTQVA